MKKIIFSFTISLFLIHILLTGCIEKENTNVDSYDIIIEYDINTLNSRFGFMHPDDFGDMTDMKVFWQRPHPGPFIWGEIETSRGFFNWEGCDKEVKNSQRYGVNIVATIWPFADWDQSSCHFKLSSSSNLIFKELGEYRQKPCDMISYKNFITKLVERYDGDGINDMPGLVVPIKYWEVSNEPEMQEDWLVFFTGSAQDYFYILNETYKSIKNADNDALVLKGGMAGVMVDMKEFWGEVFDLGGSNYFDIGNIHSINSESYAINGPEYKEFLDGKGIDKPFWITEVELDFMDKKSTVNMSDYFITNLVSAFASGAEKIFVTGIMKKDKEDEYLILQLLVDKIDYFNSSEKLGDSQFKFTIENKVVYVLWGENNIPTEIIGQVKVTDINGSETVMDAEDIILTERPVFIEILKDYK